MYLWVHDLNWFHLVLVLHAVGPSHGFGGSVWASELQTNSLGLQKFFHLHADVLWSSTSTELASEIDWGRNHCHHRYLLCMTVHDYMQIEQGPEKNTTEVAVIILWFYVLFSVVFCSQHVELGYKWCGTVQVQRVLVKIHPEKRPHDVLGRPGTGKTWYTRLGAVGSGEQTGERPGADRYWMAAGDAETVAWCQGRGCFQPQSDPTHSTNPKRGLASQRGKDQSNRDRTGGKEAYKIQSLQCMYCHCLPGQCTQELIGHVWLGVGCLCLYVCECVFSASILRGELLCVMFVSSIALESFHWISYCFVSEPIHAHLMWWYDFLLRCWLINAEGQIINEH